jgi:signal transduction histidine kinase
MWTMALGVDASSRAVSRGAADDWVLQAVAGISDALLVIDEHARLAYFNKPAERLGGLRQGDGVFYPDERTPFPVAELPLLRALQGSDVRDVALYVEGHAVPQGVHLRVSANALRDGSGRIRGAVCIAREITERRRLEQDLRDAKDELERRVSERTAELAAAQEHLVRQERLAVLGQLAGGVAHQIRNPLAAIMNATYVLKRHLASDPHPNVTDAIGIIHDEVRHANIIITGLLDYARVRTPDRHPASLVEMLERILSSDWVPSNIRVVRDLPTRGSVVQVVDVDQLQGAIANLVRNAIEAMPDGGELGVELGTYDDEIIIAISDTGTGISPQVRAHLFEPLHSTKPLGIGLGLVTARRFVEAHGGRIVCVDVPKGARFEVHLPNRVGRPT